MPEDQKMCSLCQLSEFRCFKVKPQHSGLPQKPGIFASSHSCTQCVSVQVTLLPSAISADGSGVSASVTAADGNKARVRNGVAVFKDIKLSAEIAGTYIVRAKPTSRDVSSSVFSSFLLRNYRQASLVRLPGASGLVLEACSPGFLGITGCEGQ